jgi:hypothetical protein
MSHNSHELIEFKLLFARFNALHCLPGTGHKLKVHLSPSPAGEQATQDFTHFQQP